MGKNEMPGNPTLGEGTRSINGGKTKKDSGVESK